MQRQRKTEKICLILFCKKFVNKSLKWHLIRICKQEYINKFIDIGIGRRMKSDEMDICTICSIVVTKRTEIGIVSYLSQDSLLNLHEIWLHTHDIYLPYRVKHFDENHSSFRDHAVSFASMYPERFSVSVERYLDVYMCVIFLCPDITQSKVLLRTKYLLRFFENARKNISYLSVDCGFLFICG